MNSSQHKSKDDDEKHGRPQGVEADTGKNEHEHEHGKEVSEQHSSHVVHDQGNKHSHGHGHGHSHREEEHVVGGRERADILEYLDAGGMAPAAVLEIGYKKATGGPYDVKVEGLIGPEQIAKQQQSQEEEAGSEKNKGVIYEF